MSHEQSEQAAKVIGYSIAAAALVGIVCVETASSPTASYYAQYLGRTGCLRETNYNINAGADVLNQGFSVGEAYVTIKSPQPADPPLQFSIYSDNPFQWQHFSPINLQTQSILAEHNCPGIAKELPPTGQ